jgi:thiosulfate dehydrogenase
MTRMTTLKLALIVVALALVACGKSSTSAPTAETATMPPGRDGSVIQRGRDLVGNTKELLPGNVTARLNCSSCHLLGDRPGRPLSLAGIYGEYPQFSRRTNHFVGLRDRIAECFFFSMNGKPPSYYGPDLIAIEAYIAFLSRGARVGPARPPVWSYAAPKSADLKSGAAIYSAQCAACHSSNGAGNEAANFPPLWGPTSFNDRAGMDRMMPGFVQANMPLGRGGTLSDQQAADVSAYVLSKPRPHFKPSKLKNLSPSELKFLE